MVFILILKCVNITAERSTVVSHRSRRLQKHIPLALTSPSVHHMRACCLARFPLVVVVVVVGRQRVTHDEQLYLPGDNKMLTICRHSVSPDEKYETHIGSAYNPYICREFSARRVVCVRHMRNNRHFIYTNYTNSLKRNVVANIFISLLMFACATQWVYYLLCHKSVSPKPQKPRQVARRYDPQAQKHLPRALIRHLSH